jgi:hypothetical protein
MNAQPQTRAFYAKTRARRFKSNYYEPGSQVP